MVNLDNPFWRNDLTISKNMSDRFNKRLVHFLEIPENFQQSQTLTYQ